MEIRKLFFMTDYLIIILFCVVFFYSGLAVADDIPLSISKDQRAAIAKMKRISSKNLVVKWDEKRGVFKFISGHLTRPSGISKEELAREFIEHYRVLFGVRDISEDIEFDRSDTTSSAHFIHFKQKRGGLDVIGGKITIRVYKGIITTVANYFEPHIPVATTPALSMEEAESIAKSAVDLPEETTDTVLSVFPWEEEFYLVYRIDFQFKPDPKPTRYRVYVDANNGDIILIENRIMHNGPAVGTGIGLDGILKTLHTYKIGGTFYLGNLPLPSTSIKIKTFTANNTTYLPGTIMTDGDNYWEDPAGVDAHFYGNFVFKFYKDNFSNFSWFGDSSFSHSGGLISTVHFGTDYDNAFWNGSQMVYGDGDVIFYPLSGALDVVAHEITHGVTEAINSLVYCKEPGALNESWSDVMGMFASIDYGDDLPYWAAEEIMKVAEIPGYEAYYALRRLDDPPFRTDSYPENDYNPAGPLNSWGHPEHTSEQYIAECTLLTDWGGVHINSGIPSKAAYLITIDIGSDKAKQIYYYAMFYLSSTSEFADARYAVEQATIDLYGTGSELSSVQNAFDAVGIP